MTTTTDRLVEQRPATTFARPPRYRWVPIYAAVLLFGGSAWGGICYYLASH